MWWYIFYFVTSILIRFSYTFLPSKLLVKSVLFDCYVTYAYFTAFCFFVLCSSSYLENREILSWVGSNDVSFFFKINVFKKFSQEFLQNVYGLDAD